MAKRFAKLLLLLKPKRRWMQFSLGKLFLLVTVLCAALGMVAVPAERQRRAVAAIEALGGSVSYATPDWADDEALPRTSLRRWLPQDYFDSVNYVDLQALDVADSALVDLCGLTGLEKLDLSGTQVTGAGFVHLQGLARLKSLDLDGAPVTDAGLAGLHGLTGLEELDLSRTQVTGAGLAKLRGLTGLQELWLHATNITDAGLAHLHGLSDLHSLGLAETQVTDAGVAELWRALPNCQVIGR